MRKSVLAGASVIAIALATGGAAWAADVPVKAAPRVAAPLFNWSGWYIGGAVGSVEARIFSTSNPGAGTKTRGTALLGYNIQSGNIVWGLEGDVTFGKTHIQRSDQFNKVGTMASLRGRLGWAFDRILVYGTGGVGYLKVSGCSSDTVTTPCIKTHAWRPVVGAGIEGAVTNNWILGAEYLAFLGTKDLSAGFDETTSLKKVDEWRVRLTYKFDTWGGKGPVSAKY